MSFELQNVIKSIKPLSPALMTLLETTAREHARDELLRVIQFDSVLTAKLLQAANSAAFRRAQEIVSLDMAISLLGERFVTGMAMRLCSDGFFEQALPGYESEPGDLWRHSIKTGMAARLLCRHAVGNIDGDQAFTAGILHDIGKVVLSANLTGQALEMVQEAMKDELHPGFLDAERQRLGINHCQAGLELARQWKLPECYQAAIAWHHQPDESPVEHQPMIFAVHLGDALAMMTGAATGADGMMYPLSPGYQKYLRLGPDALQLVLFDLEQEYAAFTASLSGEEGAQ